MPFPLDPKWISAMEVEMGIKFPALYKAKLLKENGGEFSTTADSWWLYPAFDQSDRKRISRTCNSIAKETAEDRKRSGFPQQAVSIGHNGGGDQLILLPEARGSNQLSDVIYWWNHETDEVTQVADDIVEALAKSQRRS